VARGALDFITSRLSSVFLCRHGADMIFIERSPQLRALGQHRRPEKLMSTVLSQYGRSRWDTSGHLIHKDHYCYRPTAIRCWLE